MDRKQSLATLQSTLTTNSEYLKKVVPKTLAAVLTPERMTKLVLQAASARGSAILTCTPQSVLRSVCDAVSLGLEVNGPLRQAYLVPFNNKGTTEAQMIIGYGGLIALARRSGQILSVSAHTVHENDRFEVDLGSDERLVHVPNFKEDRGAMYAVYSVAKFVGGGSYTDVMGKFEVDRIRKLSKAANGTAWSDHYDEMAKKTVIRRASKYWPLCIEMLDALAKEDSPSRDLGIDMDKVIDGAVAASDPEPEDPKGDGAPEQGDDTESPEEAHDSDTGEVPEASPAQGANQSAAKEHLRRLREAADGAQP